MELRRALDVDDTAVVSFVGAGGKKTAMAHLVREAGERSVAYTTTTNMPPPDGLPLVMLDPDAVDDFERPRRRAIALARGSIDDPDRVAVKVRGFPPGTIDRLSEMGSYDWILVKADGARGRELTAPAAHEPQIPACSSVVVVVVSVAAIGQAVDSSAIHRPDRVGALAEVAPTDTVSEETIAAVIADDDGGLKGIPPSATAVLLVNKADTDRQRAHADGVIGAVRSRTDRFDRALATSLTEASLELVYSR